MPETDTVEFHKLTSKDEVVVKGWLRQHLRRHIGWWVAAMGPSWTRERIDQHIDEKDLIHLDWVEMLEDGESPERFSVLLWEDGHPLGMVHGGVRTDRYLLGKKGFLGWIFVDPSARGRGLGKQLMEWVDYWLKAHDTELSEIFVTQENGEALRLYEAFGYRTVDIRMLRGKSST